MLISWSVRVPYFSAARVRNTGAWRNRTAVGWTCSIARPLGARRGTHLIFEGGLVRRFPKIRDDRPAIDTQHQLLKRGIVETTKPLLL